MTKCCRNRNFCQRGFSLIELLAVLVISTLVVVSALAVYSQMQNAARQIDSVIDDEQLPTEVLQRIAQDLDRIVAPLSGQAADVKISVKNKPDGSYESAQLKITKTYLDNKNQKQVFEEITWQSNYDFTSDRLILYRSHSGLTVEDNVLAENKTKTENTSDPNRALFIPVAAGLSCFKIQCLAGTDFVNAWAADTLPGVVKISISFALPYQDTQGNYVVPEDQMITRTVAIDRTRQIKFQFIPPDLNDLNMVPLDANSIESPDANEVNDVNVFDDEKPAEPQPNEK
jgi:prepilin-type N-terminal cleavage/methylation domain-containing protein